VPVTGANLRAALDALLAASAPGRVPDPTGRRGHAGCVILWSKGHA